MFDSLAIASRLRQAMADAGMTDRELIRKVAERGGTHRHVSELLGGTAHLKPEVLHLVAEIMGVSVEWLAYGTKKLGLKDLLALQPEAEPSDDGLQRLLDQMRERRRRWEYLIEEEFPRFRLLRKEVRDGLFQLYRDEVERSYQDADDVERLVFDGGALPEREETARAIGRTLAMPLGIRDAHMFDRNISCAQLSDFAEAMLPALRVLLRRDEYVEPGTPADDG